jgi:hypothetical protein
VQRGRRALHGASVSNPAGAEGCRKAAQLVAVNTVMAPWDAWGKFPCGHAGSGYCFWNICFNEGFDRFGFGGKEPDWRNPVAHFLRQQHPGKAIRDSPGLF